MSDLVRSGKRFNMIVSILITILLWFYVVNVESPVGETILSDVPFVVQGTDVLREKGLIVTDLGRETVNIKAVGKRKTFLKLYRSNVTVSLDVSEIDEVGEHKLSGKVTPDSLRLDNSITLSEKDNFSVTVTIKKLDSKEVPVFGEFIGDLENGFEAEPIQVDPGIVEVSGPEDVIARISHAVVLLEGENIKDSISLDAPFELRDGENHVITDNSLEYQTKAISAFLPVVRVFDVPLKIIIKDGGGATAADAVYSISPSSIRISGSEEKLKDMSEIVLGEIDLAEVFQNKSQTFSIPIPEEVENRRGVTEATVHITVNQLPIKAVTTNQISIVNPPNGHEVTLVDNSLQVWLRGKQAQLDEVSGENIHVVVDMAGVNYKKGQTRVMATVYLDGTDHVGVVGTDYSVAVVMK